MKHRIIYPPKTAPSQQDCSCKSAGPRPGACASSLELGTAITPELLMSQARAKLVHNRLAQPTLLSMARSKLLHSAQRTGSDLSDRQGLTTLQQEYLNAFGEFACDSSKRFEAAPDYSFERIEAIGQLLLKVKYRGWVFFPAVAGKAVAGPIVFLCHGQGLGGTPNGYYATAFLYLMKCLASNGMVAISIETETAKSQGTVNSGTRAEALLTHIKNVVKEIKVQKGVDLQGQQLVLLGHSQGGEAVAIAADAVRKGLIADFKTVKAVVALAPRFVPTMFTYASRFAESFLVIHGSHDLDLYDSSGIKFYEFADKTMVYKGLVWILGGTHAGFIDAALKASTIDSTKDFLTPADLKTVIGAATQNWLASVYVLEFLLWRLGLKGTPAIMRGFFLPSKQNQPPVPPGTHDATLQPPLFADASSKELRLNDLAVTSGFAAVQGPIDISKVCTTSANRDLGYRLKWDLGQDVSPFIRFSLAGQAPTQLLGKSLLFNAVRVVDSPDFNVMTDPLFLKVSLGAKGLPPSAALSVRIPDSVPMTTVPVNLSVNIGKTVMCTLNVIFGSFPGMSALFLDNLSTVTISISGASKRGDILLATPRISLV